MREHIEREHVCGYRYVVDDDNFYCVIVGGEQFHYGVYLPEDWVDDLILVLTELRGLE